MDTAHKQTIKILEATNRKAKTTYQNIYKKMREKFADYYSKIELNANMTAQEKLQEANKYDHFKKLTEFVVENLLQTNKDVLKGINKDLNGIYQLNYNAMADNFKKDGIDIGDINKTETKEEVKENEDPYNQMAINTATDKANLNRSVSNSLISSILKVASVGGAFTALKQIFEKNLESSVRIAETQTTMLENMARYQAMQFGEKKAEKQGLVYVKVWRNDPEHIARGVVRDAHARAEGQEAKLDEPFYIGGEALMYPGDYTASPENRINCGCFMEYRLVEK